MAHFNRATGTRRRLQEILFSVKRRNKRCAQGAFGAAVLFAVWLSGCNNTCFTFTSNPPTGTVEIKAGDPKPTCRLTTVNGAVRVQMRTEPACDSCAGSGHVQHIFLSIRGIEVHPSTIADEDSPDWHELAPQLARQPQRIDLMKGSADRHASELLRGSAAVPAGTYRQVRVRFVPNRLATDHPLPDKNACGSGGFNCVVTADGRIQPLLLDGGSPELRIASDKIEGGFFLVLPDIDSDLVIELTLVWSWYSSAAEGVRLVPSLTGNAKVERVEFDELGTPADGVVHDSLSRLAHD